MAEGRHKNPKIKKYRRPVNLNIGMIIFMGVLIYVIYCVINYFQYTPVMPYEVVEGSLSSDSTFTAIALREENIVPTSAAGYLNYYVLEGERVASGDLVCTVDETGRLNEYLESLKLGENTLTDGQLSEFRGEIMDFMHEFDPASFSSVYNLKYSLDGTLLRLASESMLNNLSDAQLTLSGTIQTCYAPISGIVTYWTDGYENMEAQDLSADMFVASPGESDYVRTELVSTSLVQVGDPAYKVCTSENWSIVIPVDEEYGQRLLDEEYVLVRFLSNQYESWGRVSLVTGADGNTYAELSFTNSMVTYATDRFLDVEIKLDTLTGLKIPLSSIAEREFFLIPEDFIDVESESKQGSVLRRTYLEDGTVSSEVLDLDIYSFDSESGQYYLDTDALSRGDILLKADSQETYAVSISATLLGVYNMNKGYADFKEIEILDQNDEYAIVQPNTTYGLSVYDNIVLDASSVIADELIYE